MLIFWSVCNDACQWVLNALKFVCICMWDARVKWIAVVKFAGDKWICKSCGCRKRKKMTNCMEMHGCLVETTQHKAYIGPGKADVIWKFSVSQFRYPNTNQKPQIYPQTPFPQKIWFSYYCIKKKQIWCHNTKILFKQNWYSRASTKRGKCPDNYLYKQGNINWNHWQNVPNEMITISSCIVILYLLEHSY